MTCSAKFGHPPANAHDRLIVQGALLGKNPDNGIPAQPSKPVDYVYETKGPGIIAGCAVCIAIMASVTLTRLYLRWFSSRMRFGWDDVLIIPALVLALVYPSLQIAMVTYGGAGQHMYDVTYEQYYLYHWISAVAQIDFFVCVGLVKMSIATFNIRLTGLSSNNAWIICNWTFFGCVLAYIITAFFLNIFHCLPAGTGFDYIQIAKLGHAPKCISVADMNLILRVINILLDWLLLAVPIVVISSLQMSWKRKLRVTIVFGFGALACIGSVLTLVAKYHLKTDAFWNYTNLLAWSLVELVFGVIAASLPALSSLLPSGMSSTAAEPNQYPTIGSSGIRTARIGSNAAGKPYLGSEEAGIMRYDEFEMQSAAISKEDLAELKKTHAGVMGMDGRAESVDREEKVGRGYSPLGRRKM